MAEQATQAAPQRQPRAPRRNNNRRDVPQEPKEFDEIVVNIARVARVVKGGRRFRFKALVVVGNNKGKVQKAFLKAVKIAKQEDIKYPKTLSLLKTIFPWILN